MKRYIKIIIILQFLLLFFSNISYTAISNDQELYEMGIEYLNNYKSTLALECFFKIVERYPSSKYTPKSITKVMQTYYFFQEYKQVTNIYKKYEELIEEHMKNDSSSVDELFQFVLASYYDLGEYDKVLYFSKFNDLGKNESNQMLMQYFASAALKLNNYTLFEKYDNKITNYYSKCGLGFILYEKGRIKQAFNYFSYFFDNLTEKDLVKNDGVQIIYSLGFVYIKYDKGIEFQNYINRLLEKMSYKEENLDRILFIVGVVQLESKMYNEAIQSFKKIKEYYPKSNLVDETNKYIKMLDLDK